MAKTVSCGAVNVVALGASGTGKTSFLAGIFHTFFWNRYRTYNSELIVQARSHFGEATDEQSGTEENNDGSFISNLRNFKTLRAAVEQISSTSGVSTYSTYDLDLYVEDEMDSYLLPVSMYDYKGGIADIDEIEKNTDAINDLLKNIHGSDVIYVLVDSTIAKQYSPQKRNGIEKELCTRFFSEIISSVIRSNPYKPKYIQFVLTKWDAVNEKERTVVEACVRDVYDDVFRECRKLKKKYGWKYDMLPVSLFGNTMERPTEIITREGNESEVTKYQYEFHGEMEPERIDVAFLSAIEKALTMKCDWAMKNCRENDLLMQRIYELLKCYPLGRKEKRKFLDELEKVKEIKDRNVKSQYDSECVQKMIAAHPAYNQWENASFISV